MVHFRAESGGVGSSDGGERPERGLGRKGGWARDARLDSSLSWEAFVDFFLCIYLFIPGGAGVAGCLEKSPSGPVSEKGALGRFRDLLLCSGLSGPGSQVFPLQSVGNIHDFNFSSFGKQDSLLSSVPLRPSGSTKPPWSGGGEEAAPLPSRPHPPPPPCRTPPNRRRRSPAPCAAPAAAMPSRPAPAGTCPPSRMSPKGSWAPKGSPKRRKKEKSSSERGWRGKEAVES